MARITEVVSATAGLKTLSEALIVSEIDATLATFGPYTFFAPTEDAFDEMGADALVALAADEDGLATTLLSHIVPGRYLLRDLATISILETLAGTELFISIGEDQETYVEEARIVRGDVLADNGIVHLVDLLILPLLTETPGARMESYPATGDAVGIGSLYDFASDFDADFDADSDAKDDDRDDSVAV